MILSIRVQADPVTRKLTIEQPQYVPTYIHRYKSDGLYRYLILKTNDEAARAQLTDDAQKAMDKAQQRVTQAIGEAAALRTE